MIKSNRKLGMIGIHVGLVLPLIFAAGSLSRITGSIGSAQEFNNQLGQIHNALAQPGAEVTLTRVSDPESDRERDMLMEASWVQNDTPTSIRPESPWKPYGYQSVGMISIAMLSVLAFAALLLHRPEIPKAEQKEESFGSDE